MEDLNVLPVLLEEQVKIIEWSRELRKKQFSVSTIIEWLVSNDKISKHHKDLWIEEMRQIYKQYSPSRELIITAILMNHYRLKNDIQESQIVSDGEYVGYAFYVDYTNREFQLYSNVNKENDCLIGYFSMNDFRKV